MANNRKLDWEKLKRLTYDVPFGLDKNIKKEIVNPSIRDFVKKINNNQCYLCLINEKNLLGEELQLHHIIPNGSASKENLVYLCTMCHNLVHLLLYLEGKWRYTRVRKGVPYG